MHKLFFSNLMPGTLLFSRFALLRCVCANHDGGVYLCADTAKAGKLLMLKILSRHCLNQEEATARLLREMNLSRWVKHQNVVRAEEFFADDDFAAFTMEFVPGGSLAERFVARESFPLQRVLRILNQLCGGLQAIHEAHILHRDIKPENVLLSFSDDVKIIDFGVSIVGNLTNADASAGLSGSLNYLSPEYLMDGGFDQRSDIYSLGVVAYELATGRLPFIGANMLEALTQRVRHEAPAPHLLNPRIPRPLSFAIIKAMRRDPSRRFQSVAELREALGFMRLPNGVPCVC
jgi:serine/threonine protein kinase